VESKEVAEYLKANSIDVELLVFEDEGQDVIKFRNKVPATQRSLTFSKNI
jgi:hypothetical protein